MVGSTGTEVTRALFAEAKEVEREDCEASFGSSLTTGEPEELQPGCCLT